MLMWPFSVCVLSFDASLGKIDKSTLSQQTLMDLFIERISNNEKIRHSRDDSLDKWAHIQCDDDGNVTDFNWSFGNLEGSIDLKWLPPTLKSVRVSANCLEGTLDLTDLPDGLEILWATLNRFSGTISLDNLPQKLQGLNLTRNKLSGAVNLTKLPESLELLYLSENSFCGTVDVTQLPKNIEEIHLDQNDFEGETDFTKLPERLIFLDVRSTRITGAVPAGVNCVKLRGSR
mmetsp:Transcript_19755/g.30906  ORF Transcript_19755/g.30906 Transcript_19755/m.30906 type:complete len:232 (-) Transcript_19755:61-756(-)